MDAFDALKDRVELYNLLWMWSEPVITHEQRERNEKFNDKLLDVKEES